MGHHRVAAHTLAGLLHRFLVVVVALAVSLGGLAEPAAASSPALTAASAGSCAYDMCGVTFTTKSGREYLAARPAPWRGMVAVNSADAAYLGAQKALSFQDVGDGTVYIRDVWGRCLASSGVDAVQFQECAFAPNERWYFQGQGRPGLFAVRHFAKENGDHDDRCLDVNDGHPGVDSRMHLYRCKDSGADWQMFGGSAVDAAKGQAARDGIYDRASKYASLQCEKQDNITCSYTPGATAQPALTAPEMLAATAVNYQSTTLKDTISVKKTKTATVTWGFSQKLTVKVEANIFGFAKEEYALENAWSWNRAKTDTTEISQSVEVQVPVNAMAWVAYAQLTQEVKGNIRFVVKDTGKGWTGESTVVLPIKNDGSKASVMVVCDSLSTKPFCLKTAPTLTTRSADVAPQPSSAEWLVTVEGDDHACSGTALDERWVVTAKHCPRATQVRYTADGTAGAPVVAVDRIVDSPRADVRLLHLAEPHALAAYPTLDLSYRPQDGDVATAFTVGRPAHPRSVSRETTVAVGRAGDTIAVRTDAAPDLALDSGGPLVVDGKIVGVAVVADPATSTMQYANLRSAADLFRETVDLDARLSIDVAPTVTAGTMTPVTVSRSSAAQGAASVALEGNGGMAPADTKGSLNAGGVFSTTALIDAWAVPGSRATVTASADGRTARAASRVVGANALGAGTDVWGGLGVRTGGWNLSVTRPDQLKPVFPSPIVQSASNKTSVAVVLADGTVWAAGQNGYHELVGSDGPVEWTRVEGLEKVTQIAMTEYSTAALLSDGTVMAWGSAGYGQLGGGNVGGDVWGSPRRVEELSNVVQVVASPASAYAVLADGTVRACGWNDAGQLGDGTTTDRSTYAPVRGVTDVVSVAAVGASATALRADGTVLYWGADENRRPVAPRAVPGLEHVRSLSGGIALHQNGTVSLIQAAGSRVVSVDGLSEVSAVAGTGASYWALRADGTLMAWGRNDTGQLGVGFASDVAEPMAVIGLPGLPVTGVFPSSVGNKALFTVGAASVDVAADGRIVAGAETAVSGHVRVSPGSSRPSSVGLSSSTGELSDTSIVPDASGAFQALLTPGAWTRPGTLVEVTASSGSTSAVTRSRVAGANAFGVGAGTWGGLGSRASGWPVRVTTPDQLRPVFTSPIAQLASNGGSVTALLEDGTVWGVGQNGYHEIAGSDGPVVEWTRIGGLSEIQQIAMTEFSAVALQKDGTVLAWGTSGYGQLGSGARNGDVWSAPREVDELSDIVQVAGGGGSVYALASDGTVRAAGFNDAGQLGDGSRSDSSSFVAVGGLDAATSLAPYGRGVLALRDDGTAWYWGQGQDGAPAPVAGLTGVAAVSGRVALLADGSVRVVSEDGRTSAPVDGLHDVVSVRGDGSSFYAVLPGGSVKAWGSNDVGQLGDGTTTDRQTPIDVIGLQGQPVTAVFTSSHRNKAFFITGNSAP